MAYYKSWVGRAEPACYFPATHLPKSMENWGAPVAELTALRLTGLAKTAISLLSGSASRFLDDRSSSIAAAEERILNVARIDVLNS